MIFGPRQLALGQAAIAPHDGGCPADTISFLKFSSLWDNDQALLGAELGLDRAVAVLSRTADMQ